MTTCNTKCQKCRNRRVVDDAGICNECLDAAGQPKRPHGLTGRTNIHRGSFTPAELEETRQQMLATPYEQIKQEFMQAVAESKEKPKRRPAARRNPVTLAEIERAYRKALGELEQ